MQTSKPAFLATRVVRAFLDWAHETNKPTTIMDSYKQEVRQQTHTLLDRAVSEAIRQLASGAAWRQEKHVSGGITCLTLLVYHRCSSKVANDAANRVDP